MNTQPRSPSFFPDDPAFVTALQDAIRKLDKNSSLLRFFNILARQHGKKPGDESGRAQIAALFYDQYFPDMRGETPNADRMEGLQRLRQEISDPSEVRYPADRATRTTRLQERPRRPDQQALKWLTQEIAEAIFEADALHKQPRMKLKNILPYADKPVLKPDEYAQLDMFTAAVNNVFSDAHELLKTVITKAPPAQASQTGHWVQTIAKGPAPADAKKPAGTSL